MLKNFLLSITLVALSSAKADTLGDDFTIKSFYTLDLSHANQNAALTANSKKVFALDKDKTSFINSVIGSQVRYEISDNLTAVAQGIAFFKKEYSVEAELEWAYLNYDLGNDNSIRVGSFQTPLLKGTELRSIGFSRLWLSPLIHQNGASGFNE